MIVVDANVVAYLLIEGSRTGMAREVLRRDGDWAVPRLWRSELRSIAAGHFRAGDLPLEACVALLDRAEGQMAGGEFEVPSRIVMDLVARSGASAYDCEYVALALDLGVSMVSNDRRLGREFPDTVLGMEEFVGR